jgi:hypothetical protein
MTLIISGHFFIDVTSSSYISASISIDRYFTHMPPYAAFSAQCAADISIIDYCIFTRQAFWLAIFIPASQADASHYIQRDENGISQSFTQRNRGHNVAFSIYSHDNNRGIS